MLGSAEFLRRATQHFMAPDGPKWATPGDLARFVMPETQQTAAMQLIDDALMELHETPNGRLIIHMPPQEGKSTRVGEIYPLWTLQQDPKTKIVLVSHSITLARRNSRHIRDFVEGHGIDLDLWLSRTVNGSTEWEISGHAGGCYAIGVGGSLTGRRSDLMVIDDPIKDMIDASSEKIRENVWDWWLTVGSTRASVGSKVVLIMTRWHEDDLAGRLMNAPDGHRWKYVRIPAEADHDPAAGQTDPLGRAPGEFMHSAQGERDWVQVKAEKTPRVWQAMYQGRPSPAGGGMLKTEWWKFYQTPLWEETEPGVYRTTEPTDEVIMSWDCAFKNTRDSDYVVGQVWVKRGPNAYLVDQIRRRMTFTETVRAAEQLAKRWPQADVKLIEDKANGTAVLDVLRPKLPGLIAVNPQESKEARVSAVSFGVEAGNVWLPDPDAFKLWSPWIGEFVEECAAFPTGSHDDQVDAMSQALNRLMVNGGSGAAWLEYLQRKAGA